MLTLGINKGKTIAGKPLRYGGAAVCKDGEVLISVLEERIAGKKWAGGFEQSLPVVLKESARLLRRRGQLNLTDFDSIAVSTCCESIAAATQGHDLAHKGNLITINHHLAHATYAFHSSRFKSAIIVVIDGGGNTLSDELAPENWWEHSREQHSYYVGHGSQIELVGRDCDQPYAVGFGELYRALSYFLGFRSSRFAQKVMALAAYGRPENISPKSFVVIEDGCIKVPARNEPKNPEDLIYQLGRDLGIDFGEPRKPETEILQAHCDIASYFQRELELALRLKLEDLTTRHRIQNVCLAGGFALNCVVNGYLASVPNPMPLFVPAAPGDEGQAIGASLAANISTTQLELRTPTVLSSSAQLGVSHSINSGEFAKLLKQHNLCEALVFEPKHLASTIAELLSSGALVCSFQGRSEVGLRALGNRSIFADPRRSEARAILNQIKSREWFQPFAPAIIEDFVADFFEANIHSPFMSFALVVKKDKRKKIPAVVHSDGTARLQTVREGDSFLFNIINEFKTRTGIPLILNTSFNHGGAPVVETPAHAVATFAKMPINTLVLDRFLLMKSFVPELQRLGLLPASVSENLYVIRDGQEMKPVNSFSISAMLRWLQNMTGQIVFVRSGFPLYGEYLDWLYEGRKVTTIRFRKGGVEFPSNYQLSLFATTDYTLKRAPKPTINVKVEAIKYQKFGELTKEDALRDGFKTHDEMVRALTTIYPKLQAEDWVTIYRIAPQ